MELTKTWLALWLGIALFVTSMIVAVCAIENNKTIRMAQQGYEEVVCPGRQSFAWQKAK